MRLQDLNWMDVEQYLERDARIILVTGATEQHAYLSLLTDILIPARIADAASERTGVVVAPPLNFGVSQIFGEFPGTISLSRQTFEMAVVEIVESLLHQGFRRFFILNGHEGNRIPEALEEFQMEGVIQVMWYDWWRGEAMQRFEAQYNLRMDHANWGENFAFTRVAPVPDGVKPLVNLAAFQDRFYSARAILEDGSYGGPYQIDDDLMFTLFDQVVDESVALLTGLQD